MSSTSKQVISKENVNIHIISSPLEGELVNSIIIELQNQLVMIDVPLLKPHAKELRDYANGLGKTINRIIVTHFHPDHWGGLEFFTDLDIYALAEVQQEIEEKGDWALSFHREIHGDLISDHKVVPNKTIKDGPLVIDDTTINVMKIVDAEIRYMLAFDIPSIKTLIAQDVVYNKVFLFLGEKTTNGDLCFDSWIKHLQQLKANQYETVIPGHGEPLDASLLDENIAFLIQSKEIVQTSNSAQEFKQRMLTRFSDYRVPFLLDMANYFLFPETLNN